MSLRKEIEDLMNTAYSIHVPEPNNMRVYCNLLWTALIKLAEAIEAIPE